MKGSTPDFTSHTSHRTLYISHLSLLAILLLASSLRFYRLDAQSFWNDEGNSARIAERTFDLILEGAAGDIHPPGYYLLLHCWRALVGQSEFALRSLSTMAGLVLVAFTYLLGRRLFDRTTGLIAAFLGAISPFAIYYSQEARMYTLLAALSVASTYLLLRLQIGKSAKRQNRDLGLIGWRAHPTGRYSATLRSLLRTGGRYSATLRSLLRTGGLGYILIAAAGLYTHYAFPFVMLVHNGIFGLWWLALARRSAHRWRWLVLWFGTQIAAIILYLPWLPIAFRGVTGWPAAGRAYELRGALVDVLRTLSVGITLPIEKAAGALVGAGLLLLAGLSRPNRQNRDLGLVGRKACTTGRYSAALRSSLRTGWFNVAVAAMYLLLPIALIFALDLYKLAWLKFLIVVLPPFHILLARGVVNLAQSRGSPPPVRERVRNKLQATGYDILHPGWKYVLRPASCVLLLGIYLFTIPLSLHNLYFSPAYARDDYRQIAADIATSVRPDGAIILNAPNQWEVFTYYYPDRDVYPAPYHPDSAKVEAFLAPLIERYRRLLVLYWGNAESDPQGLIEAGLAANAYKAGDRWYGRVRLATYGVAPLPKEPAVALDARFGADLRLRGYALAGHSPDPGDVLPVTLFWEAQAPITERYKVTVQLLDDAGQLVAQHDTEPGDGLAPTTTWGPGQTLVDRYGVIIPPDLPPGRYTLIVGVYHITTGERLPVTLDGKAAGDHLILGSVEVHG